MEYNPNSPLDHSSGLRSEQPSAEWTPSTHHQVPQPAGHECADWYERVQPSAEEILYALAHTKGQADTLLAQNRELVEGCQAALAALRKSDSTSAQVCGGPVWTACHSLETLLAKVKS